MPTTTKDLVNSCCLVLGSKFCNSSCIPIFCPQRYCNKKRQNLKPEGVNPDKDEKHYQMLIRPLKSFSRGLLLEMARGKGQKQKLSNKVPLPWKSYCWQTFCDQNYKDRPFISEEVLKHILQKVQWHREHILIEYKIPSIVGEAELLSWCREENFLKYIDGRRID